VPRHPPNALKSLDALIINAHPCWPSIPKPLAQASGPMAGVSNLGRSDRTDTDLRKTYMCSICLSRERSSHPWPSPETNVPGTGGTSKSLHSRYQSAYAPGLAASETCFKKVTGQMPDTQWVCLTDNTGWWSQTGSNRRPEACKATALPTELWPRLNPTAEANPTAQPQSWWAWEDLNFRPHAYQARALTN
jgi:hypothetical protein